MSINHYVQNVCFKFQDLTAQLALSIAACTLGSSFQFGYNTGIVNAPEKVTIEIYMCIVTSSYYKYIKCLYLSCLLFSCLPARNLFSLLTSMKISIRIISFWFNGILLLCTSIYKILKCFIWQVLKGFYNKTYQDRFNESLNCDTDSSTNCTTLTILWATTVSIFCIGGMVGGVSAGYWANRFGRYILIFIKNFSLSVLEKI